MKELETYKGCCYDCLLFTGEGHPCANKKNTSRNQNGCINFIPKRCKFCKINSANGGTCNEPYTIATCADFQLISCKDCKHYINDSKCHRGYTPVCDDYDYDWMYEDIKRFSNPCNSFERKEEKMPEKSCKTCAKNTEYGGDCWHARACDEYTPISCKHCKNFMGFYTTCKSYSGWVTEDKDYSWAIKSIERYGSICDDFERAEEKKKITTCEDCSLFNGHYIHCKDPSTATARSLEDKCDYFRMTDQRDCKECVLFSGSYGSLCKDEMHWSYRKKDSSTPDCENYMTSIKEAEPVEFKEVSKDDYETDIHSVKKETDLERYTREYEEEIQRRKTLRDSVLQNKDFLYDKRIFVEKRKYDREDDYINSIWTFNKDFIEFVGLTTDEEKFLKDVEMVRNYDNSTVTYKKKDIITSSKDTWDVFDSILNKAVLSRMDYLTKLARIKLCSVTDCFKKLKKGTCPKCKTKNKESNKFCKSCGYPLHE